MRHGDDVSRGSVWRAVEDINALCVSVIGR